MVKNIKAHRSRRRLLVTNVKQLIQFERQILMYPLTGKTTFKVVDFECVRTLAGVRTAHCCCMMCECR